MHAIIRCGQGQYYVSAVFGYYCNVTSTDDYQRYLEKIYNCYYLVLNKEKNKVIKKYVFDRNSKYLDQSVLIVDSENSDWSVDDTGQGCAAFMNEVEIDDVEDNLPKDILQRCIQIDAEYQYNEYRYVLCQKDIEDLMCVSGQFHDACIKKISQQDDGLLYVLFEGIWGCQIGMWFSDEVSCCTDSRDPEKCDPYWFGSTMQFEDGFLYFVDDEDMKVSDITDDYCWFKAKKLKYHVIPNE